MEHRRPLLLLAAGRPELREARSSLASTGRLVTDVVTLGGLDAGAATRLAANVARLDAAIASRDAHQLSALFAHQMQSVTDRLPGGDGSPEEAFGTWRSLQRAEAPRCRHEPLATLDDSLVLCRQSVSASGFAGRTFDVGAYEREAVTLVEVDSNGRQQRAEFFAISRLGDAVARLYERHAELLPKGPERARAAATARSVVALLGPPDRWLFAPEAEATDHRTVGFGSLSGGDAVVGAIRALVQLSDDWTVHIDHVLDLRSDALFVRWTTSGTLRASGGAFERQLHMLWVFGADGLLVRWEQFDAEQDAEALARFDELRAAGRRT